MTMALGSFERFKSSSHQSGVSLVSTLSTSQNLNLTRVRNRDIINVLRGRKAKIKNLQLFTLLKAKRLSTLEEPS